MKQGWKLGWPRGVFAAQDAGPAPANILALNLWPTAAYAVGDVHGCFDLYRDLEARIAADVAALGGVGLLVLLGDVIDRGPMSAALIDHLIAPAPPALMRMVLRGNHEEMFARFLRAPAPGAGWLHHGGLETLASYGIDTASFADGSLSSRRMRLVLDTTIPPEHRAFLDALPDALILDPLIFVHAGVDPAQLPQDQTGAALRWGMVETVAAVDAGTFPLTVVHGHTPQPDGRALVTPARVNLDTGAYASGKLSAARFMPDGSVTVFEQMRV